MSPKTMHRLAKPMLFAAAMIWGTSFFIMKNALDVIPVFFLLALRFTAGAVLLALIVGKRWKNFTPDYLWRGAIMGEMCIRDRGYELQHYQEPAAHQAFRYPAL